MKKLILLVFIAAFLLTGCYQTSEGTRVGTIIKFSKKGFFAGTWEGEMILGGAGASGNDVNTWRFSVDNEDVVEQVKNAQATAGVVTVEYHQEWKTAPWRAETNYFIDSVIK